MGRISGAELAKYSVIGSEEECYYCGAEQKMWDLTPSYRASDVDKTLFRETWTRSRVCEKCWTRIHTANWVNEAVKYGVPRGCMTVPHKRQLCSGTAAPSFALESALTMGFDGSLVVPRTMIQDASDPDVFYCDGVKWSMAELVALQGPLALVMVGATKDVVRQCFWSLANSLDTDLHDVDKYTKILEISHE